MLAGLVNKGGGRIALRNLLRDFIIVPVEVPAYPELVLEVNEHGELFPSYAAKDHRISRRPLMKMLPMILKPDGTPALIENLFLHEKMNQTKHFESVDRIAQSLLSFCRFCNASEWITKSGTTEQMTYRSLTGNPEEGAPWLYADFLFENLHVRDPSTGLVLEEGISPATAMLNIRNVAAFYGWMIEEEYLKVGKDCLPYNSKSIKIVRKSNIDSSVLSHTKKASRTVIVETSDLVQRFSSSHTETKVAAHEKLRPMTPAHRELFESRLVNKQDPVSLMCRLCLDVGLRVKEAVTFPESVVQEPDPKLEVVTVKIGRAVNNCETKFSKARDVEIPYELMLDLYEYKLSDKRLGLLEKHKVSIDDNFEQVSHHRRLFVSTRDAEMYSKSTLQRTFSEIRKAINAELAESNDPFGFLDELPPEIREFHLDASRKDVGKGIPLWYYRPHDMRSTYATRWLLKNHAERELPFEMLLDELADLMGHKSVEETRKYTQFIDKKLIRFRNSMAKNARASMLY